MIYWLHSAKKTNQLVLTNSLILVLAFSSLLDLNVGINYIEESSQALID